MTETLRYALIMLAAGIGIPILAALNAQLGGRIGSPAAAATVLFVVACGAALIVTVATGGMGKLALIPAQPRHLLLAGLLVAFYVLSITWVAPRFGIGNAIFFVLLGQLISATLIDQFGLFGAAVRSVGPARIAGLCLMALGVYLCQKA
ncbi:DMT family transporter [Albidovulum sediminicola]|uniref:DMT family transporter n=1 Tax=Albidovulum sediminicola TaxID=2984331 RepID=A0ABT2Z5W9_9RHOB|nr:DMT family transporter [Defluviimonas sp. WL0075]MCV2866465.1 DMT family transporter [Defluviimonas sp. WL0075]